MAKKSIEENKKADTKKSTAKSDLKEIKETKEKSPSKKKETLISAKKLPPLFKKEYTKEKFEKKIGKHIFIQTDRTFIEKIFTSAKDKNGNEIIKVDLEKNLPKSDLARYKILAKQINAQKGGIKLIPLLAVVILIIGIGIVFTLFKNVIIKSALTSSMQGIFQAKTDIEKIDFKFLDSSLDIRGLQQANKDSPMKNIFQTDKIFIDFNLADLCRGKFHAENIIVSGVAIDTDRKTSGELPKREKIKKQTKEESEIAIKAAELKDSALENLMAMFADYNPETMLADLQNQLKSPALAAEISNEVQTKIDKWKEKPTEITTQISDFSTNVNSVLNTNWNNITDLTKLKSALETINKAAVSGDTLKKSIEKTSTEIKTDAAEVNDYAKRIETAVSSDLKLVETKVNDVRNLFSPAGLKEIMNQAIQSILYSVLGKYYPYFNTAVDKAMEIKQQMNSNTVKNSDKKTKKKVNKAKKEKKQRLKGQDIYFKADRIPKILINNAVASGYEYGKESVEENLLFKGEATDISSNPDMLGKPAKIEADFKILGKANNAKVIVDARSETKNPLISAEYLGKGYPIKADAQIFNFDSTSNINANFTTDENGSFTVGGNVDLLMNGINGMEFEPARVCKLYKNALSGIKSLNLNFTIGFDKDKGLLVSIDNLDKLASQLVAPVTSSISTELNSISNEAKTKVSQMLSEKTGIATEKITQFTDIQALINTEKSKLDSLNKKLDAKKNEIQTQITNAAKKGAVNAASTLIQGKNNETKNSTSLKDVAGGFFKK